MAFDINNFKLNDFFNHDSFNSLICCVIFNICSVELLKGSLHIPIRMQIFIIAFIISIVRVIINNKYDMESIIIGIINTVPIAITSVGMYELGIKQIFENMGSGL